MSDYRRAFVRAGLFPADWGGDAQFIGEFGERGWAGWWITPSA